MKTFYIRNIIAYLYSFLHLPVSVESKDQHGWTQQWLECHLPLDSLCHLHTRVDFWLPEMKYILT